MQDPTAPRAPGKAGLQALTGVWKIVWILSPDEGGIAALFTDLNVPGTTFEFHIRDDCWIERELSSSIFNIGTHKWHPKPKPLDGTVIKDLALWHLHANAHVEVLPEGRLALVEELYDPATGATLAVVRHELRVEGHTMYRRVTNLNTGSYFVVLYTKMDMHHMHRSAILQAAANQGEEPRRKKVLALMPAIVFYPIWLYAMAKHQIWRAVFAEFYPMTVAMVVGSFIAGSTPLGGGVVGFPVAVLFLKFDAVQGRDFSVLIQCIGMSAASYLILYLKPELVHVKLVTWSIFFGTLGLIIGFSIAIDSFVVNVLLTTYLLCFGVSYYYKSEVMEKYMPAGLRGRQASEAVEYDFERAQRESEIHGDLVRQSATDEEQPALEDLGPTTTKDKDKKKKQKKPSSSSSSSSSSLSAPGSADVVIPTDLEDYKVTLHVFLVISALLGGFFTSKLGSGADSVAYVYGTYCWNRLTRHDKLSESMLTASTVIIMATMSCVTVGIRLSTGHISRDAIHCWCAAAPIVCLGAPLGSLILDPSSEHALRKVFYVLCVIQFVFFGLLIVKTSIPGWTFVAIAVALTLSGIAFHFALYLRPKMAKMQRAETQLIADSPHSGDTDVAAPDDDDDDDDSTDRDDRAPNGTTHARQAPPPANIRNPAALAEEAKAPPLLPPPPPQPP